MTTKIKDAITWAAKLADTAPEKYQAAAFGELLRQKLQDELGFANTNAAPAKTPRKKDKSEEELKPVAQDWISIESPEVPTAHLIRDGGSEKQKVAWAVIGLSELGEFAITENIRNFIQDNLAISPPNRQNTNRALRALFPQHLSRSKHKRGGFTYLPKPGIQAVFKDLVADETSKNPA